LHRAWHSQPWHLWANSPTNGTFSHCSEEGGMHLVEHNTHDRSFCGGIRQQILLCGWIRKPVSLMLRQKAVSDGVNPQMSSFLLGKLEPGLLGKRLVGRLWESRLLQIMHSIALIMWDYSLLSTCVWYI
jgi:hypothetical protein